MGADTLQINGRLYGSGRIVDNVVSKGRIDPGNSPGVMRFDGVLALGADVSTVIEIMNAGAAAFLRRHRR